MSSTKPRKGLSATTLAAHHHLQCDLFLYNSYHGLRQANGHSRPEASELTKAQFQRGDKWEATLFDWLDKRNLLLQVLGGFLKGNEIQEVIEIDERPHFFVAGVSFLPPPDELQAKFRENGQQPVKFSIAKPDLIEVRKGNDGIIRWQVVDAKSSVDVKTSHHVQIYFYHMCLEAILSAPRYQPLGTAAVWIPPSVYSQNEPSFDGLRTTSMSLLALPLDEFLFNKLPTVTSMRRDEVKWHLNPLCHSCAFERDCTANALRDGELGVMPNITIQEAEVLRNVLAVSRSQMQRKRLPDIEDLDLTIRSKHVMRKLELEHPSTMKKARRILKLPEVITRGTSSPVVNAARTKSVQTVNNRIFTLPNDEDIALIISLVINPATNNIVAYCVSTFAMHTEFKCPAPIFGLSADFISSLSSIIEYILDLNDVSDKPPRTQCYVFSPSERTVLQRFLIDASLTADPLDDDLQASIRTCIGALCEGASLLATSFQPLILSGALLDFLGKKGDRTTAELKTCLKRLNLPNRGGNDEALRAQILEELNRLKRLGKRFSDSDSPPRPDDDVLHTRPEIGQLPRVVVLKKAVERLLALPVPGHWDLPECHTLLTSSAIASPSCPSDEAIFTAYTTNQMAELKTMVELRNNSILNVLSGTRLRLANALVRKADILVNEARVLTAEFMDICRQDHLRKLFFMQQFEVLARLNNLWQERMDGCVDSPRLQYQFTNRLPDKSYIHYFSLLSGYVDLPSDKERSFFGYILTEDTDADSDIPVEALFDDLGVFNLVFPLNKYMRPRWSRQPREVRENLFIADVQDTVIRNNRTLVVLRTFGDFSLRLKNFARYRLSPRLVDFNVTKVLSTLVEIDLQTPDYPGFMSMPPALQLFSDPAAFARMKSETSSVAEGFLSTERAIYSLFKELHLLGNTDATSLILQESQRRALGRILKHRLAVIWGPPGTGKTYTVSLSLLRLVEIKWRYDRRGRQIIFLTAMTHAAIDACILKLRTLMRTYKRIPNLELDWLDTISLERVLSGATHPLPGNHATHIYAGTVYQLYNFSKRSHVKADCIIIDEAGQLGLGAASLVLKSLQTDGRVIVAGDSEQLAPILTTQYPQVDSRLFGSVLDCLMYLSNSSDEGTERALTETDITVTAESSQISTVVQLTENFRLNPDLGEFVSTIYRKAFKPQTYQHRRVADQLSKLMDEGADLGPIERSAREILVALSAAMRRQPQILLQEPKINGNRDKTTDIPELDRRAISLSLVRISANSQHPERMGYEAHVQGEAMFAAALVRLIQQAAPDETIFVATPHRVQRHAVKDALRTRVDDLVDAFGTLQLQDDAEGEQGFDKQKVTIDTVERLQGSEAAFVICLFAHTFAGNASTAVDFLLERRRLNVAISRAKTLCILVTSQEVLRPSVRIFANTQSAKGFTFLKAFEDRAWSADVSINLDGLKENN